MIAELTAHFWQSTFFAVAAGLLTVAFRGNRAQVRYWLWLSASVKFFIPFALLMNVGSRLKIWAPAARQIATPAVSYAIEQFSQPFFPGQSPSGPAAPATFDWTPFVILGAWLCGFVTIALIRFRNWLRIRSAVRGARASALPPGFCPALFSVDIRISRPSGTRRGRTAPPHPPVTRRNHRAPDAVRTQRRHRPRTLSRPSSGQSFRSAPHDR